MSDDGQSPQPRKFEPPPWELEQFEELARQRRAESERARTALRDALETPEIESGAGGPPRGDESGSSPELAGSRTSDAPGAPGEDRSLGDAPNEEDGPTLSDAQIEAMLLQLSGEEPADKRAIGKAGKVIAAIAGAVGAVIVAYAIAQGAQAASSGTAALVATSVGVIFGGAILGAAAWLWIRSTRLQGS